MIWRKNGGLKHDPLLVFLGLSLRCMVNGMTPSAVGDGTGMGVGSENR